MSALLIVPLPGNERLAQELAASSGGELGSLSVRSFPDGETYLRYETSTAHRSVALVCTLDRPDTKVIPLLFAASAARELGAKQVGLVAPYLAYMRQDKRFHEGEAITSAYFAQLLSAHFDWLITVDPHLHRRKSLGEIYTIPATVLHAGPLISDWIQRHVEKPLIIGPDSESEQWVAEVARQGGAPYTVLRKIRRGDREVEVSIPDIEQWRDLEPVIVDDIISAANTMTETVKHLIGRGMKRPVCIGIHGIFADQAYEDLLSAGATNIVTTNSIPHVTNDIDVTKLIAAEIGRRAGD